MKKNVSVITVLGGLALLISGAVILGSCEGPAGPQGPPGPPGEDGTDGTDGVDGNAVCLSCHTLAVKNAVTAQWDTTLHATSQPLYPGGPLVVEYAGGRNDCAKCHSHEGFVETVWTGQDTTASAIPLPQPIQCETCHDFHPSLDFENEPNSAIRQMMPVTLIAGGEMVDFENNEESNLCMHCHQSRKGPADDSDGSAITYVSPRYGPHHGPQANMINGLGGYEFGVVLSTKGTHESGANCVSCHMHEGGDTGGHTWVAGIESCTGCHTDATDFDVNGAVTEIEGLMSDLEAALIAAGMLDEDGQTIEEVSYQADSVGALWNFLLVEEDASRGIHNPAYTKALLNNSLNVFN